MFVWKTNSPTARPAAVGGASGPSSFKSPSIRRAKRVLRQRQTSLAPEAPKEASLTSLDPQQLTPKLNSLPLQQPHADNTPDPALGQVPLTPRGKNIEKPPNHDIHLVVGELGVVVAPSPASSGTFQRSSTDSSLALKKDREQRILTSRIKQAQTPARLWQMLQLADQSEGKILNKYHITAAFTQLANLCSDQHKAQPEATQQVIVSLVELMRMHQSEMDARAGVNILYATTKLKPHGGSRATQDVARIALVSSLGQLTRLRNMELANIIWSLSKLGHNPGDAWLQEFWETSRSQMYSMGPQDFSNMLHAVAKLKLEPPSQWLLSLLTHSQRRMSLFLPEHFAASLHALGSMQVQVPQSWMAAFFESSESSLPSWSPQCLASTAYGLAGLESPPHPGLRECVQQCIQQQPLNQDKFAGHRKGQILDSPAVQAPSLLEDRSSWSFKFLGRIEHVLDRLTAQELCIILSYLARVDAHPSDPWLAEAYNASKPHFREGTTRDLVTLLSAFTVLDPSLHLNDQKHVEWLSSLLSSLHLPSLNQKDAMQLLEALHCLWARDMRTWRRHEGMTPTKSNIILSGDDSGKLRHTDSTRPCLTESQLVGTLRSGWLQKLRHHVKHLSETLKPSQKRFANRVMTELAKSGAPAGVEGKPHLS